MYDSPGARLPLSHPPSEDGALESSVGDEAVSTIPDTLASLKTRGRKILFGGSITKRVVTLARFVQTTVEPTVMVMNAGSNPESVMLTGTVVTRGEAENWGEFERRALSDDLVGDAETAGSSAIERMQSASKTQTTIVRGKILDEVSRADMLPPSALQTNGVLVQDTNGQKYTANLMQLQLPLLEKRDPN